MLSKLLRVLGFVWAAPCTFAGLVYVAFCAAMKWYDFLGARGDALVWKVNMSKSPLWLQNFWAHWGGHTLGNVIVVRDMPDETPRGAIILNHELIHTKQCMRLGIFQPLIYLGCYLGAKVGCDYADPYYDTIFEIDARRGAGQIVDIPGTVQRLQAQAQKKI